MRNGRHGSTAGRLLTGSRTLIRGTAVARALAVTTAALALAATAAPAGAVPGQAPPAARAQAGGWQVQHTPDPPPREGILVADSCASPGACMAVGSYQNGGGFYFPLAERWNGTTWSVQKPPLPSGASSTRLLGVSCASASACVAVGTYDNSRGIYFTLAETWNGTSWTIQPTPSPAGNNNSGLAGVSCTSASACVAVGYSGDYGFDSTLTLAETWHGTSWTIQPTPNPADPNHSDFTSVSCTSPSACTAVGSSAGTALLAERWNGTAWSIQQTPGPAGAIAAGLLGVSCPSAGACVAVGNYRKKSGAHVALAEAWDGSAWALKRAAIPKGASLSYLNGVSCTSAGGCTAVGNDRSAAGAYLTLAEVWHGSAWSLQATPNPAAPRAFLSGVSCPSAGSCAAVGDQTSRFEVQTPLAEAWDGARWSLRKTPAPATNTQTYLSGVSCPAATGCITVGQSGIDGGSGTLAEHWNGAAWSIQTTPNAGRQSILSGIACASATACTAVGSYTSPHGGRTLAEAWNGAAWSVQRTPNELSVEDSLLDSVSCAAAGSCVAVGEAGAENVAPLAEIQHGTSWSLQQPPVPSGVSNSGLAGVSCASATACVAVGFYEQSFNVFEPLAEAWNGTSWTIQPVPAPPGATSTSLSGVSCASATACVAVGDYINGSRDDLTLAEAWNGTSWSVQPTPNPAGATTSGLLGVSCASPGACTAAGYYDRRGMPVTLAEAWHGTSWAIQPTPNPAGSAASFFNGVSCGPAGGCTAVGSGSKPAASAQALAEAGP